VATVVIGADICPIGANRSYFKAGDARSLFNDLLPELATADLTIANLECPLIRTPSPIFKTGPVFGEDGDCINGVREAGIDVLSLANNHILDHGAAGVENTLRACAEAGISTVGAGNNVETAGKFWIGRVGEFRVGVAAMAEHEFSIAGRDRCGANPLDLIRFTRELAGHEEDLDYLVVLLHGSQEFFVPTPRIQEICRFLIELGANAVIVQHSHVMGGWETYLGGHIVYGQGAWIMDEAIYRHSAFFHEGFLVKLALQLQPVADRYHSKAGWIGPRGRTRVFSRMEVMPFMQSQPPPGARRLTAEAEAAWRERMGALCARVADTGWVREQWQRYCRECRYEALSTLLGYNWLLRLLNRSGWLTSWLHGRQTLLGVRNMVLCESHREVLETLFEEH
jgi:poly-gamma-glutamate synthesis protein (capsule biosynthesis protein)